jgi:hypothetical protein
MMVPFVRLVPVRLLTQAMISLLAVLQSRHAALTIAQRTTHTSKIPPLTLNSVKALRAALQMTSPNVASSVKVAKPGMFVLLACCQAQARCAATKAATPTQGPQMWTCAAVLAAQISLFALQLRTMQMMAFQEYSLTDPKMPSAQRVFARRMMFTAAADPWQDA